MTLVAGISSQNGPSLRETVSGMLSPQRFKETKLSGRGNLPEHLAQIWFCSAHLVVDRPSYLNKVEVPTYNMDGRETTPALVSKIRKQRMRVFDAWSGPSGPLLALGFHLIQLYGVLLTVSLR